MINPNIRECLVELNKLIPKNEASLSQLTDPQKVELQGMIADLLQKVLTNDKSIQPDQQNDLRDIRDLAKKAEQMHLLSKEGKSASKGIAAKTKEIGLSLFTAPLDFTIHTKDGPVMVNSDVLKENSSVFKKMIKSGMHESNTKSVRLDISKSTVEFLIRCLHAPTKEKIVLPDDNEMVLELVNFALSHGFDSLITTLEPAVTQFIDQQRTIVVENGSALVNMLKQGASFHPVPVKWLVDLTPLILDNFDIPAKFSELPGQFEIPLEHLHVLLDGQTRDLFEDLPQVLDIKNEKDLDIFLNAIQTTKLESPLPIKLLCRMELSPNDEKRLQQLAKASNIDLSIEKSVLPPGTVVFGKELWETYLGEVEDVPLPEGIAALLESPCPAFPGHTWKDKFMLVLMPKTVDGVPLTLNHFREIALHPKGEGHAANYKFIYAPILVEHGNKAVERSMWVLMSMDVIEGSRELTYEAQEVMVTAVPGCRVPDLLSAHVGILTHFIHTGERLYGPGDPWTFTRCEETTPYGGEISQTAVGGFDATGLRVDFSYGNFGNVQTGAGAVRKFVS